MNSLDFVAELCVDDDSVHISKESLTKLLLVTLNHGRTLPKTVSLDRLEHMARHAVKELEATYEQSYRELNSQPLQ